jgi:hypothetical protein
MSLQVETGYCLRTWDVGAKVQKIQWNPNPNHQVLAVAAGHNVHIIATGTGA